MGINFLIVDDSANIRAFVKKTLNMTGLEIETIFEASNGKEGLEVLSKEKVDVALTDINMPVMDGLEMIRLIKENGNMNNLKIIVISTEGSREKILEAAKLGVKGYLRKPFGPENVMEILNEAVTNG
ncbi:MAG: response regulator [Fibrobacteres bacterium]|nr:response regulator [Fibrobacterota bacterium]